MASTSKSDFFFFFTILLFTTILGSNVAAQNQQPKPVHIPIKKDSQTLQYYASLQIGTPPTKADTVLDLGGRFLSLACDKFKSSSCRAFSCGSSECKAVSNTTCGPKDTCPIKSFNPFNKNSALAGVLSDDVIRVPSASSNSSHLSFSCVDSGNLKGLAKGISGILGLGRLPEIQSLSLLTSLINAYNLYRLLALCLPSSAESGSGSLVIGGDIPELKQGIVTTLLEYSSGEYYMLVNSIKIDNRVVHFNSSLLNYNPNGVGGTKISTSTPYGVLHSAIYKAVVGDFVKRAAERNITQVAAVAPFGACFSTKGVRWTKGGPRVPTIDLMVPVNSGTYQPWRILGANSMVRVNKDVLCLGFVDGGNIKAGAAIVLGGHILEDTYLEFDLTRPVVTLTSSLLTQGKTCSNFRSV